MCCAWGLPLVAAPWAQGVILYGGATRNTSAAPGSIAEPGWQLQGQWGTFLGTPISPNHFVTAKHAGQVGAFTFGGRTYTIDKTYGADGVMASADHDLAVWKVKETFPAYAPLYTTRDETARHLVVFGRGTERGQEVRVNGLLKGWQFGADDHVQSWGENDVTTIANLGTGKGEMLRFDFDAVGAPNEAHLSNGDSGGGVFIKVGGEWRLAGINYAIPGPYSLSGVADDPGFRAAIYDRGGLYASSNGSWVLQPDIIPDQPGCSYATRISSHLDFLTAAVPEPGVGMTLLAGVWGVLLRRKR